jgi:hypothetical protein
MSYLESAAATAKPPRSNMMTGVHIAEMMYFVAALASNRTCGFSSDLTTLRTTQRNGMSKDVTKRGMTYVVSNGQEQDRKHVPP